MRIKYKDWRELVFLSLWFAFSFLYILNASLLPIGMIFKLFEVGVMGVLGLLFFLHNKFNLKKIIMVSMFVVCCLLYVRVTGKIAYIIYILFIINSDYTKFNKIAKITAFSVFTSTVLVILMSQVGIIQDYIFIRDTGEQAHSLGFVYYYNASAQIMFASILYLYVRDVASWLELILITAISLSLYFVCTTRLPFIILLMALTLYVVLYKFGFIKTLNCMPIKLFSLVSFPTVCFLCVYFAWNYDYSNSAYQFANDILNGRPRLSHLAFKIYGVKLLGQEVEMKGRTYGEVQNDYFFIDSGYILSVIQNGILFTLILIAIYCFFYYYACKVNDKKLFIWISMILVFNIVNGCWFSVLYNPIFFILFHMNERPLDKILQKLRLNKKIKIRSKI